MNKDFSFWCKKISCILRDVMRVLVCLALFYVLFVIVVRQPASDRDWVDETKVSPKVTILNDRYVQIQDIRDWSYSSGAVLSKEYLNKTFDVNALKEVYFLQEPFKAWEAVAHTFFVFEFSDGESVSFSIEARKEIGEKYSAWKGLWRNFELAYTWGTERDFVDRRITFLDHDVFKYKLFVTDQSKKDLFLELARGTQDINASPRFYNTFTSNCTNLLADHANNVRHGTISWFAKSRILPGYSDKMLYYRGLLHDKAVSVNRTDEDFLQFKQESLLKKWDE